MWPCWGGGLCRAKMLLRALSGVQQHQFAGVGGDGLGTMSNEVPLCNTGTARPQSTASRLFGESVSCRHESLVQPHMAQWMLACSPAHGRDSFRCWVPSPAVLSPSPAASGAPWLGWISIDRAADINQPPPDLSPPSPSTLLRCTNAGTRPARCPSDTRPSLSDPYVHRPLSTHSLHAKKGMFQPI
jgi:hypothetical protein